MEITILVLWPLLGAGLAYGTRSIFRRWRQRGWARVLAGNIIVVLFAVYFLSYALEIGLRVQYRSGGTQAYLQEGRFAPFFRGSPIHPYQSDDRLGWVMAPSIQGNYYGEDCSFQFSSNAHGMRGPQEIASTKSRPRIMVLGDSFAFGHGVNDGDEWPRLLGNRFPDWEVLNCAVSGYSDVQSLLVLQQKQATFTPEVVIHSHYPDMLWRNGSKQFVSSKGVPINCPSGELQNGVLTLRSMPKATPMTRSSFLDESYLYNYISMIGLANQVAELTEQTEPNLTQDQLIRLLEATLARMRADALAGGAQQFLAVYIPGIAREGRHHTEFVLACKQNGIDYLDLTASFKIHQETHPDQSLYFPIDAHPNQAGNRLIAEQVESHLLRSGWLAGAASEKPSQ